MISAGARPSCSHIRLSVLLIFSILALQSARAQSASPTSGPPNETWAGRRIVTLQGFGDYFVSGQHGQPELIRPDGLGVNIVIVVQQVEGEQIWIKANGAGDVPVGWVNKKNAILLDDAIPYFTSLIDRNPKNWDPYLRRAESEHALNQREAAVADYTRAIELHRDEPFLFLRRGRVFRTMKACPQAAADFEKAANLKPTWAELYNQAAGVYVDCPDPARRNPEKALALIEHAIALDVEHPTYLTVLALAYLEWASLKKRQLRRDKHWNRPNSLRGIVRRRQRNYTSMREHSPLRTIEKLGIRLARRLFVMSGTLSESAEPVSDWLTGQTVRP